MKVKKAIGLMSGSSLDGLDIAYCEFFYDGNHWKYSIKIAETVSYSERWKETLKNIRNFSVEKFLFLHNEYGMYLGEITNQFISKNNLFPEIIASHGHTVFHNPSGGYTFQLGNGQAIANITGIKTVADFRTGDILLGGQGAPLVPIGDELLFSGYTACVNIGGIANISFINNNGRRIAYDICPANQLLNYLAGYVGKNYDKNGEIAEKGKLDKDLLYKLNADNYYNKNIPKSLSNEYVESNFIKNIEKYSLKLEDKLHTVSVHIAEKIASAITYFDNGRILITGGGAKNSFLIKKLRENSKSEIFIPDETLVDFKEALIFAFMGILKKEHKVNCLSSATGALRDCSTGVVFEPV